ncbi:MAG: YbfB/YjiJ family MFS transporter [Candidatus Velthaea sp.]
MTRAAISTIWWGIAAIAADIGLARLGYGVFLPSICSSFRDPCAYAGALSATHLAGYLAGTLAGPAVVRRAGTKRAATASLAVVAAGLALSSIMPTLVSLATARVLTGVAAGINIVAIVALVVAAVPLERRGAVSGWLFGGLGAGIVLCGIGAPFADGPGAWRIAHSVMALFAAVVAVGLAFVRDAGSPAPGDARFDLRAIADPRGMLFLVIAYAGFGFGYISYATFAGTLLAQRHATHLQIGIAWAAFGITAILGALFTGALLESRAGRYALAIISFFAGAGGIVTAYGGAEGVVAGAALVGAGLAATPGVASALARARSTTATYPAAFAAMTAVFGIGQFAGPIASGGIAHAYGLAAVPLLSAAAYLAGSAIACADARIGGSRLAEPKALRDLSV